MKKNRIRDNVTARLQSQVSVSNIRQSLVFNVSVETQSPIKSAQIADTLAEIYILNQIEVKFEATEQATEWLSNRVSELQIQLETAEKKVSDFTAQTQLVSVEGLQALERQIKDLRDRISNAEISQAGLKNTINGLKTAETSDEKPSIAKDATLSRIANRGLSSEANQNTFDLRYQTIVDRVRANITRSEQQLAALRLSEA